MSGQTVTPPSPTPRSPAIVRTRVLLLWVGGFIGGLALLLSVTLIPLLFRWAVLPGKPSIAWYASLSGKAREPGMPPLGLHVVLGPDFALMARNLRQGLVEGRVVLAQVIARKSG